MDTNKEPYSCGDEVAAASGNNAFNSFVAGSTHLFKDAHESDKYDRLMKHFDRAVLEEIQKDVVLSCIDAVWEQAFSEGYRKGLAEFAEDVPLRKLTGKGE